MIVHFFVALAQKNCPRALASTTSRSDWRRHSGPANLFYSINKFYSHPASRDQLTDQEQCEAAKRITTCAKILPIAGPKTKRQKCSGFQGRQSGPPQFKNMCGHKRSQGVENNCSRRCKTMGTQWHSGMRNFCRVPAETIETCTIFRPAAKNLPSRPDTSKSFFKSKIKLRLNEWPPFWGPFLDPKTGAVLSAEFQSPGEKWQEF